MSYKIGYRVLDYVEGRGDVFIYGMKWVYALAAIGCIIGFIISLIDKLQIRHVQKSNESKITEQSI